MVAEVAPLTAARANGSGNSIRSSDGAPGGGSRSSTRSALRTIVEQATVISSLEQDLWHAFAFSLVKDGPLISSADREHTFRFGLVTILTACNMVAQLSLMSWLWVNLVRPSIKEVQDVYGQFHAVAFDETGNFLEDSFKEDFADDRGRLCQFPIASFGFLYLALFLWVAQCMNQVFGVGRLLVRVLWKLPRLPARAPLRLQVVPGETEDEYIVCLSLTSRAVILAVVCCPKVFLVACLTTLGCVWLIASQSYTELVFQSLALAFFLDLEELIFAFLMPERAIAQMERTHFACPGPTNSLVNERDVQDDQQMFDEYCRSFVFLLAVAVSVGLVLLWQQVVPNFQWDVGAHCQEVWRDQSLPWCRPWETECFPYGKASG